MNNKIPKYGCIILVALILCIGLPVVWLETYIWQNCWFPPSGPNVEIIVSACEDPIMYGVSRDGRYLSYALRDGDNYQLWLLDTLTGKRELDTMGGGWWLTSTIRIRGEPSNGPQGGFEISDISDGSRSPLQWVESLPGTTTKLTNGSETYSPEVLQWFRSAEQVYYISSYRWAVALGPDFKIHPQNTYILARGDDDPKNSILKFLKDNQMVYQRIGYPGDGSDVVSHNGRFVIPFLGDEGFYTTDGKKIGPLYDFMNRDLDCCSVYGWAYDDSGIYVQANTQGSGGMFPYPPKAQSILKINLPPEYLSPVARQALNVYQNHVRVEMMIKVLALILLLSAALLFFWWRKRKDNLRAVKLVFGGC